MSLKMMSAVWETPMATHTMKLVLLSLADQASDEGVTWPSLDSIAQRCDLTRQSVITQIEKLVEAGFLEVETRGGRRSNRYTVSVNGVDCNRDDMLSTASSVAVNGINPVVNGVNVAVNGVDPIRKEPSKEPKRNPKGKNFVAPTFEDVLSFCAELSLPASDGEAFFWGKQANGWKNGTTPIKDWRATIRSWKAAGYHPSQKHTGHQRPVRGAAPQAAAQAPAVAGGPVTVAEWVAHWETVLERGWVPCPLNFGTPESEGYYAAIERRSAAMKAAACSK